MKRILILYVPLGAGHGMAARAIEEAFFKNYPDFEIKNINVLDFAFEIFRAGLPKVFNYVTRRIPFLYKLMYDCFDRRSWNCYLNRASGAFIKSSRFVEFVKEFNPDFILATNPLPMQLVSLTKHQKIIDILSANVCTDFGFHSLWYNPDVNYYFVANEDIKKSLIGHGAAADKIIITGIPIASKFSKNLDRQEILSRLGLKENFPVLLIVGGKMKYNTLSKTIKKINAKISAQFIVVAGRDEKLEKKLANSRLKNYPNIKIFGFVKNLEDYMTVSNLILTKAGGVTVAECLQKELPMIINDFIPGQEEDNVKYVVKNGAGFEIKNTKEAVKIIVDLLAKPEKIKRMKENCRKIARPSAAKELADFVASKLK